MVSLEFLIDIILPSTLWPWVDSASNRNEYQEYFLRGKDGRCVGLTTISPSCADCLWNLGASTSWDPQGLSRTVMGLLYLYLYPLWHNFENSVTIEVRLLLSLLMFYAVLMDNSSAVDDCPSCNSLVFQNEFFHLCRVLVCPWCLSWLVSLSKLSIQTFTNSAPFCQIQRDHCAIIIHPCQLQMNFDRGSLFHP